MLAREDRIPLGVGVLALVFHISVRGYWWSGGYWGSSIGGSSAAVWR
ncbi:MAG: hypothetical protein R2855_16410 [Thermomicrobiales bacterium]